MPISPLRLLVLTFLLGLLLLLIQVNLLAIAFDKLGLSPLSGMLLLIGALAGSTLNLPVARIRAWHMRAPSPLLPPLLRGSRPALEATILVAVNVGGCIIPVCFSVYYQLQFQPTGSAAGHRDAAAGCAAIRRDHRLADRRE